MFGDCFVVIGGDMPNGSGDADAEMGGEDDDEISWEFRQDVEKSA